MATNRIKLLDLEREHILSTLRQCRGNRTHTARSLGISVRGLRIKLASYAEMGADVPPPAAHSIAALGKAVHRDSAARRCVERTLRPPNLDNHVRSQLGLSLRIFYDAILCSPLPPLQPTSMKGHMHDRPRSTLVPTNKLMPTDALNRRAGERKRRSAPIERAVGRITRRGAHSCPREDSTIWQPSRSAD